PREDARPLTLSRVGRREHTLPQNLPIELSNRPILTGKGTDCHKLSVSFMVRHEPRSVRPTLDRKPTGGNNHGEIAKRTNRQEEWNVAAQVALPAAFDPQGETQPFLARIKKKASKNFRWTSTRCLQDGAILAFWSHVFEKDEEPLDVC